MRIGLIAPPWIPVPPPAYGGLEAVVDNLARGLAARGHEVRLFTVGESTCPVTRRHVYPKAVAPLGNVVHELTHVLAAYHALADVDLIHDHTVAGPLLAAAQRHEPPVVTTVHSPFIPAVRRIVAEAARHATTVAISHAQARAAGPAPITAVIHHGVDVDFYRPGPGGGGYLLFIGRMCADKGVHRAIRVARRARRRLVVVAKMREADERAYCERMVAPLLGADIDVRIESTAAERLRLLRHADALINPIRWPEPFGLVMAEALACGTPVLAFPNGAAPEVVDHGRTGYLCSNEAAMVTALDRVADIDRHACRSAAVHRFSMDRMARDHEALYGAVLARHRSGPPARPMVTAELT
jgi:glycosyltransferase involved in cell wall biosynthesis